MLTFITVDAVRDQVTQWKQQGYSIALVPTMGNLHAGHLALVDRAKQLSDKVIVSIFVNPTQFAPGEDYEDYPRTQDADAIALDSRDVDGLFMPSVETMYGDVEASTLVSVPSLNHILCGKSRPGHFDGVATVVCKLFNLLQPDIAVFGQKDFQQLAVIQTMVRDLALPIEIIGQPTHREVDGLAMSSRNSYMSADQRLLAPQIFAGLKELVEAVKKDPQNTQKYRDLLAEKLTQAGFEVEYVEIRRQFDLKIPEQVDNSLVALVAVKIGVTRLIDNLQFELE